MRKLTLDCTQIGTKAGLRIPSTDCWNGSIGGPMKIYRTIGTTTVETEVPVLTGSGNLFDHKIRTFLDASRDGTAAPIPSSQILYNQAILDGIARSSDLGREIEIEIPEI